MLCFTPLITFTLRTDHWFFSNTSAMWCQFSKRYIHVFYGITVLGGTFSKIWLLQIKLHPPTRMDPTYGHFTKSVSIFQVWLRAFKKSSTRKLDM